MGIGTRVLDAIDASISQGRDVGIMHLTAEDEVLRGARLQIDGRETTSFASCSYLGLEFDPRLKEGAIRAIERYGTQFSASRSYVSAPLYEELEDLLQQILGGFPLVVGSTTLAHIAAIPSLIDGEDAALLDHDLHQSARMASNHLRAFGTHIETVRHNDLELLSERIADLERKHRHVWYVADGVYSAFGDLAPTAALRHLLERHPSLHLYIDDAHGMSWTGSRGSGSVLDQFEDRSRLYLATSLNKSFAAAGGALVLPTEESRRRIRTVGGTMIFSGPVQPPMLGAAVASARLHVSGEIERMQAELLARIEYCNRRARELDLPLASFSRSPIRFLGVGVSEATYDLVQVLLEDGFLTSGMNFPAVPARRCGTRFSITRLHSEEDIDALLHAMAIRLPERLARASSTPSAARTSFGLPAPRDAAVDEGPLAHADLHLEHERSFKALDANEWDAWLLPRIGFDLAGLGWLEETFREGAEAERWSFHYYTVRDAGGRVVLQTFFTVSLAKADLLSSPEVSRQIEARRLEDSDYLTVTSLAMGCPLTEGDQLFLDRDRDWQGALRLLDRALARVTEAQQRIWRDLPTGDDALAAQLVRSGHAPVDLPLAHEIRVGWEDEADFEAQLSSSARRFMRKSVTPFDARWQASVLRGGDARLLEVEPETLRALYLQVAERNLTLNTQRLPLHFFERAQRDAAWEWTLLHDVESGALGGFSLSYRGTRSYVPLLLGMEYRFVEEGGVYRQLLRRAVLRGGELGHRSFSLGMGADTEKRRFGGVPVERKAFVASDDDFDQGVLALLEAELLHERSTGSH